MLWYLSFAAEDGFRGACIVEAPEFLAAVEEATRRNCNPHGECRGFEFPPSEKVPDEWKNRLLSVDDIRVFDAAMGGEGEACGLDGERK